MTQEQIDLLNGAIAALGENNFDLAINLTDHAQAIGCTDSLCYALRGSAFQGKSLLEDAIKNYTMSLEIGGPNVDTYYNLGNAHMGARNFNMAIESFAQARILQPNDVDVINNLALSRLELGDFAGACQDFEAALALSPHDIDIAINYSNSLKALGKAEAALAILERAHEMAPQNIKPLCALGAIQLEAERTELAKGYFLAAEALAPNNSTVLNGLGATALKQDQTEVARTYLERAVSIDPKFDDALVNLGVAYRKCKQFEKALEIFEAIAPRRKNDAEFHHSYGNLLWDFRRYEDAVAQYQISIDLKPDHYHAHFNLSAALLVLGRYAQGWVEYEYRWQSVQQGLQRHQNIPRWRLTTDNTSARVLVYAEQGYGDTIQFARYIEKIAPYVGELIFEVPLRLKALMQNSLKGCEIISIGEPLPPIDYQLPLLSLPLELFTILNEVPSKARYLFANATKANHWEQYLSGSKKKRIGIAWAGNPAHKNDQNRTAPLASLRQLFTVDCEFVSLQISIPEHDRMLAESLPIRDVSKRLVDFSDTAALINQLDLVITVDTSIAHLAGALGKPVWLMMMFCSEWRWLADRPDSPWYPSMTIYRQQNRGDWDSLAITLTQDLQKFVAH